MAQTSYPFSNSPILDANQWSKMAQNWLGTGVIKGQLNELLAYADFTGMQVKVKTGQAYLKGHFFESNAEEVLAIGVADSANPRIDRVILRVDWVANTIQLAILQGVAAVTPTVPALTQNSSRWEISLAQVRVNAAVTTIAVGNITDERAYAPNQSSVIVNSVGGMNVQSGVVTKVYILTGIVEDIQTEWANAAFVAKESGLYDVRGFLEWASSTIPTNSQALYVYKNGAPYNTAMSVFGANTRYALGTSHVRLSAGDKIEFYILQDSSGVQKTLASARFEIAKMM